MVEEDTPSLVVVQDTNHNVKAVLNKAINS